VEELKETRFFIIKWAVLLDLLLIGILVLFDIKSAFGLFVGALMSIVNFYLLSNSLQKAVKFPPVKAGLYVFVQYILRYTLWFLVFYISLQRKDVSLLTTIIGMLTVKIVILITNAFSCWESKQVV